jgi:hypothetical protein
LTATAYLLKLLGQRLAPNPSNNGDGPAKSPQTDGTEKAPNAGRANPEARRANRTGDSEMEQWERPIDGMPGAERRKHERFCVRNGSFAELSPQFTILGQIMNISTGGLAFRYVASAERSKESSKLSILLTDGSFRLDKIRFQTIWDAPMPREFSFGAITLRQCGVRFGALTHGQQLHLQYFMRRYSGDEGSGARADYVRHEAPGR